eukprot:GAHX01003314.1.p1 GENE.GAHX01003314.1~~GAHX01003314.1.p1  ORF type:complete len:60 (-),score=0.80 GAHX01003314.1:176-355(-)
MIQVNLVLLNIPESLPHSLYWHILISFFKTLYSITQICLCYHYMCNAFMIESKGLLFSF